MPCHILATIAVVVVIAATNAAAVAAPQNPTPTPNWVWIESEAVTQVRPAALHVSRAGWGRGADVLSGGAWLSISLPPADSGKYFAGPSGGAAESGPTLEYTLETPRAGTYDVWNRVGFERIRAPFDWRIDGGPWTQIAPDAPTVDQADLSDWVPLGWLKMGEQMLAAGSHTLQIRVEQSRDKNGKPTELHYASDALLLIDAPFHPNGALKPDQTIGTTPADRAAAEKVFAVSDPAAGSAAQTATVLNGDWQITADDEESVSGRLGPIPALPNFGAYLWRGMTVPGDRNAARPEMNYVHRYWLRTRVRLPADVGGDGGRSCVLHLPAVNMTATIFVNGQPCGFVRDNFAAWDGDISGALRPGQVNEIAIGIKDAFYGVADPDWAAHIPYLPMSFWHYNTGLKLDMPVLYHFENGLLRAPSLIVAGGPAYTSDVFAEPSVKKRSLGLEITVHNPHDRTVTVSVASDVEPLSGGAVAKTFAPKEVMVPAGGDAVVRVEEPWQNPHLWWPDDPFQYVVVTRLSVSGQVIDERRTKFGFREWGWQQGANFTLNGIPWHGFEDTTPLGTGPEMVEKYHAHHQTMHRMWGEPADLEEQLDFMDAHGIVVRRTGIFDGEGSSGFYDVTRKDLWDNYRHQLAAWIKGQRNHPSIFIWSVENEITFINGHVTGNDAVTTAQHHKTAELVLTVDSTRPWMPDGGNALLDESLPVYGGHYLDPPFTSLPAGAYDREGFAHRQTWPITQNKPILLGETFYAAGTDLGDFATIGGDAASLGKAEARPAIGCIARMLSEGYRWLGINFDLYLSSDAATPEYYRAWSPVAALCREWNWTFGSGQTVRRTLGIFNDTRSANPITLRTELAVGGKTIARTTSVHHVPPGGNEKFDVPLALPRVANRSEGRWTLTLTSGNRILFTDTKTLAVLNPLAGSAPSPAARPAKGANSASPTLAVYDPTGRAAAFLRTCGLSFQTLPSLTALPSAARVLLVGKDALTAGQSTSSALAAYASGGHVVIVLDQSEPLHFQGLPGQAPSTTDSGSIAFIETPDSPVFENLRSEDFVTWGTAGPLYRNAYGKPTAGGQSLLQCGQGLGESALVQMPAGKGLLLLCQLTLEDRLGDSAVAQKLLGNLVRCGMQYRPVVRPVSLVAAEGSPLRQALQAAGIVFSRAASPAAVLRRQRDSLLVVDATPANLKSLAADTASVNAFTRSGGWIVLNGLTPDGLADYNRLVGISHLIRPFRQEKVTFPRGPRDPLTVGLPTADIVIGSGKQIFNFAAGEYPDPEAFGYVVDLEDVAPFATSPFFAYDKITNNFTMADGFWPLIINFPVAKDGSPYRIPIHLSRRETLTRFTYVQDLNYAATKRISLIFGNNDRAAFPLAPNGDPQTFALEPPRTVQDLTLEIDDWTHDPAKQHDGQDLVGIDNIALYARRPAGYENRVRPLLNIGALVAYPRGKGGIVLCNVLFKAAETVPANAVKKQTILATILRNLHAPVAGKSVIAGAADLVYTPLDLSGQANQFRNDQGWFGDRAHTFAALPDGRQIFAGVPFTLYRFTTSPVPTVVMLGGRGIPGNLPDRVTGIPVHRTADALFFLQSARIDSPLSPRDRKAGRRAEIADYVIHYADGTTETAPVYAGENVDNYVQSAPPRALPGAQIAWARPYDDSARSGGGGDTAVAYTLQWNNPHPEKRIETVDLIAGPDRQRGVPALLALTAASAP